jgi:plastocyanin
MKTTTKVALTCVFITSAQASFAVEHEVWVQAKGYFPTTIHVEIGDTIRFINKSGYNVWLESNNGDDNNFNYNSEDPCADASGFDGSKDGWVTTRMYGQTSVVVEVTSCMETHILGNFEPGYPDYGEHSFISFDEPDLGF